MIYEISPCIDQLCGKTTDNNMPMAQWYYNQNNICLVEIQFLHVAHTNNKGVGKKLKWLLIRCQFFSVSYDGQPLQTGFLWKLSIFTH